MSAASGPATTPAVCEHDWRYSMTSGGYICLKCKLEAQPACSHPTLTSVGYACPTCAPVAPTPAPPPVEIPADMVERRHLIADFVGVARWLANDPGYTRAMAVRDLRRAGKKYNAGAWSESELAILDGSRAATPTTEADRAE